MNRTPAGLSAALFAALFATTLITAALFAGCTSHAAFGTRSHPVMVSDGQRSRKSS